MSPSSDTDDLFPAPPGLEAAWLKLVRRSKQFQESKNEGAGSREDHLDAIAAAWAPFLKSELLDLGVLSKQYTLLMTGDHNKARQWSSQLGSETATKDVPLPQEVENFLDCGSSFLDKRREYIKKTAAEAAKKECETKRELALATKKAALTPKETTSSSKRARSESVGPSDVESEDQIDTDIEMDPDEDFLGTPAWCTSCSKLPKHTVQLCPDRFSENGQGRGKSHRAPSHTDAESVADAPVKKKATRVRFQKKAVPAGPAVIVDSGSPVIAFSVTAGPAVAEQNEATPSSNTVPVTTLSFDDIGKMINSGDHVIKSIGTLAQTNEGLQRIECSLRIHLSQIAARVSVESRKYDAVYAEYDRVRELLLQRNLSTREFPSVPATGTSATTPHPDPWPFQLVPARSIADVVVEADSSLVAVGITRNTEVDPEEV
ncbi:hypothetical protein DFH08DRAFT_977784 [Mycena albidolilacea]|uniref:Uncharacterized protein n=1 Tax=Mycena albidolilacea TaxID=1033008 RepID=A0AAD7E835_9AGAR|nr:hypothetical protein DFH08DRAFT_977784 [Mycena albidolilacea]